MTAIQGSGNLATETRDVHDFDAVTFCGAGTMTIEQGDAEGLTVEAEDNILPFITSEVEDGTLKIGYQSGTTMTTTQPMRFDLRVRTLRGLLLKGAGTVAIPSLRTGRLEITNTGAVSVTMPDLTAEELAFTEAGSSEMQVGGNVRTQQVTISGAGSYQAADLQSDEAQVSMNGAGRVEINVRRELNVSVSGVGKVIYHGSPTVSRSISGMGKISAAGD